MKRTPLKRKTPLSSKGFIQRKTPLKGSAISSYTSKPKSIMEPKLIRRNGLKGYGRSAADKMWHSQVAGSGCFACRVLGVDTVLPVRVHHPRGRNKGKPGDISEQFVICLCDDHHDPSVNPAADRSLPSVHGNKRLFRNLVGTEEYCVLETYALLGKVPSWLSENDWDKYLTLATQAEKEGWIIESGGVSAAIRAA